MQGGNVETASATTTGLRNLAGIDNPDGTVGLYAATATTSSLIDQGADPNSVLAINDVLSATTLPANKAYTMLEGPQFATGVPRRERDAACGDGAGAWDAGGAGDGVAGTDGDAAAFIKGKLAAS